MDMKGILIWAAFLAFFAFGVFYSRRMKKQIAEDGIEAIGTISRIVEPSPDAEDNSTAIYARYRDEDGREIEGILNGAPLSLVTGQRVRLKYHRGHKQNAVLVKILDE